MSIAPQVEEYSVDIATVSSRGGHGKAIGGPHRHRKILLDPAAEMEEAAECDEEESDEDMGFGLFDSGPAGEMIMVCQWSQFTKATTVSSLPAPVMCKMVKTTDRMDWDLDAEEQTESPSQEVGTLLQRLIARQSFEGSWTTIPKLLCEEMEISHDAFHAAADKLVDDSKQGLDRIISEEVLSTAIVVVFLEKKMEDDEETWELVAEKARTWLEDKVSDDVLGEVWKLAHATVGA
jgi:hypothetical protein